MLTSKKPVHPIDELKAVLDYSPFSGVFNWKVSPNSRVAVGSQAGTVDFWGYRKISYKRKMYKCHKLAWYFMTGVMPDFQIDHEDGIKTNNSWINLRPCNSSNNQANSGLRKNNTSGFKGVSFIKKSGKFMASIKHNYRLKNLGLFDSAEIAAIVYDITAMELFGKFAKTNF